MNFKRLNNSYPYTSELKDSLKTIFFIGLFVFLFVLIFRSDSLITNGSFSNKLLISFYYGLIAFFLPLLNTIIVNIFMNKKRGTDWKVKHEIGIYLLHFASISAANYILSTYLLNNEVNLFGFIQSVIITVLIGLIPVSFHILNMQKKLLKRHVEEASNINKRNKFISNHESLLSQSIEINSIHIDLKNLLYIESDKNYLRLISSNDTTRLRYTIKEIEKDLEGHKEFLRCHRAFIVHLHKIIKVEGNAQGLRLFFDDTDNYVPVSRNYIPEIKKHIP